LDLLRRPSRRDMVYFGIPIFANIHLCGSALTETFFVMTVALMLTVFALQDSFGTACNVTGDSALTLIISEYSNRVKPVKQ
jgi:Na+/H+-dicarboxylate symporter